MKITTEEVKNVTGMLDEIIEKYNEKQEDKKRDWLDTANFLTSLWHNLYNLG